MNGAVVIFSEIHYPIWNNFVQLYVPKHLVIVQNWLVNFTKDDISYCTVPSHSVQYQILNGAVTMEPEEL